MPATEQAARLTDAYRHRLLAIRLQAVSVAASRWTRMTVDDLDGTFDAWLAEVAPTLEAAQRSGVTLTDAYLAAYLATELGRAVQPVGIDADRFAGVDRSGQPLAKALTGAVITTKIALQQGRDRREALAMGRNRATRVVASEALGAPRDALGELMDADERVKGWRRVTAPGACGACLASATGDVETGGLKIHRFDRCTSEPVVARVRETVRRPTGREIFDRLTDQQQAALFHGRGGEEKAALIRSGEAPFEALIAPAPMKREPDGITEAPLASLAS